MSTPAPTRILVVDDDLTALLLMQAALRKAGYDVVTAADGPAALDAFRADRFDLVMLDVDMPGMSGHEVCATIRAEAGDKLPILMVTGMDDVRSVERAYDAGATDFIAKPINWALIGHRVRYLFRSYQALLQLQAADARNAAVLHAIPDLLFEVDGEGRFYDVHSPDAALLAAPPEALLGKTLCEVLPETPASICMAALHAAAEHGSSRGMQYELAVPHGTRWFELSVARKETAAGDGDRFIALARDITERKEAEQRIMRLAFYDSLTGLPNRQSFLERVDREVRRARQGGEQLAVLFMDLDGFKNVNDSMGHATGDALLRDAARRLSETLRASDTVARNANWNGHVSTAGAEVARLGGDEFTALITHIVRPDDALTVAHRILHLMRRPFLLEGREIMLTTSVGIALFPGDGDDAMTLLKHADTAMYHAKENGCDNVQFYSAALTRQAVQRMNLETDLRGALQRGEFRLVYQPQIDLRTQRIESVEALIRWDHPTRGTIDPGEFIPVAEETGLIVPLGEWILAAACADAMRWLRAGYAVRLAVNLSPLQFKDRDLVRKVLGTLQATGLAPTQLELEVTEGALMEKTGTVTSLLASLRAAGVQVAIDDFGTGYSSMGYLKRMPLNNLKVDRSFVKGLPDDTENLAIVRAILSLAKAIGLRVTAEGVETLEQALALREMDCDAVQGFYFSRPVAPGEIPALLAKDWLIGDGDKRAA